MNLMFIFYLELALCFATLVVDLLLHHDDHVGIQILDREWVQVQVQVQVLVQVVCQSVLDRVAHAVIDGPFRHHAHSDHFVRVFQYGLDSCSILCHLNCAVHLDISLQLVVLVVIPAFWKYNRFK